MKIPILLFAMLLLVSTASAYTIDNNTVYIDDANAYLSATPHTIASSGWVYFNLTSKVYTGDLDLVWGFNTTQSKPTKAELYSPHWVNTTSQHSKTFYNVSSFEVYDGSNLNYGNAYNTNFSYTAVHEVTIHDENFEPIGTEWIISNASFDSFVNVDGNYTITWHNRHDTWTLYKDYTQTFQSVTHDYQGYNKWYYVKNVPIVAGQDYMLRAWVEVPITQSGSSGKYYYAVKPSSETIAEAIAAGHFYALDPWWNSSWVNYKTHTINQSYVNQSIGTGAYPLLVSLSVDADLAAKAQADGDDIVFTNAANSTQLPHEIEYFNSTTGELVAWVGITDVKNVSYINMYYGNAYATDTQDAAGVWDDNYVMVQHLQEIDIDGGAGDIKDSTQYDNDGTTSNMAITNQVSGQIDGSFNLNGVNQSINFGNSESINNITDALTIETWINTPDPQKSYQMILTKDTYNVAGYEVLFDVTSGNIRVEKGHPTDTKDIIGSTTILADTDYFNVFSYDGTTAKMYLDGAIETLSEDTISGNGSFVTSSAPLYIGERGGSYYFEGIVDEVRISNITRSHAYIETNYNNSKYPSLFLTVSGEHDSDYFNSQWNTSKTSTGSTNSTAVKLPIYDGGNYDFVVDWGDGSNDTITAWNQANATHNYSSAGEYNISINGTITGWRFANTGDKLKILDISNWGNLNLGNANSYFYGCSNLDITAIDTLDLTGTTSFLVFFKDCTNLASLNVSNWDISGVTTMYQAFYDCSGLVSLDVSNWDTSNVQTFSAAFRGCSGLTSLDVSNWDTSSMQYLDYAFYTCSGLTELNTSNWDTSSISLFEYAFYGCTALTSLNVSDWNTVSGTTFSNTFYSCSGLTELNTSNWDTSNVTTFNSAFFGCSGLTSLNTTNWDTGSVESFYRTFISCSNITSIDTTNWDITSLTSAIQMFQGVTLNTTNYNDLLTNFAGQAVNNAVPFHGGNSKYYEGAASSARNDTLIGIYSWTIQDGGMIPAPKVTLLSQYPANLYQNTTGYFNLSWGIEHSDAGLNNTSIAMIYTLYDVANDNYNNSVRLPSNDRADLCTFLGEYILRADNRNNSLNFENDATIIEGNIYKWGGADENTTRLTIVPVNSTYTKVYWNGTIQDSVWPGSWYLDRTDQTTATMTGQNIDKNNHVLLQSIVPGCGAGQTGQLLDMYVDTYQGVTDPVKPITIFYLNDSYDPLGSVNPESSPYAYLVTTMNATQWYTDDYVTGNSSYVNSITVNTSAISDAGITPTTKFYVYFNTEAATSKSYYMNKTNSATSTNRTFAQTESMWIGDNAPYTPHAYTPNVWFVSRSNESQYKTRLYVTDNNNLSNNSGIQTSNIEVSEYPPSTPGICSFYYNDAIDYDMNGTYNGEYYVRVLTSNDPDGGPVTINLTLHYANQTLISTINNSITGNGVACVNVTFNSVPYYSPTEEYTLKVVATDDESLTSEYWLPVNFTLYITPNATTLANTTGNFYVNFTWDAGSGATTDSYNMSQNGSWANGSSTAYNNSSVGAHGYSEIIVYAYNDSSGLSSGYLTDNVTVPNNIPTLTGLPDNSTNEDVDIINAFDLDDYFADADGDPPTFQVQSNNQTGNVSVTIHANNSVDYSPAADWYGTALITYNVSDGYGGTANDSIILTVNAVNDPPILDPIGPQNKQEGETVTIDVDATDPDPDFLTYACNRTDLFTDFNTAGGITTWTTDYSDAGIYYVNFSVTDGSGGADHEIVTITITDIPLSINSYWNNVTGSSLSLTITLTDAVLFGVTTNRTPTNISWYNGSTFLENDTSTTQGNLTHQFNSAGVFYINVSAEDNYDTTVNTTFAVTVLEYPIVVSYTPATPHNSITDTNVTFNVTFSQTGNITWYLDGVQVQTNNVTTTASYTNTSPVEGGPYNVTASFTNTNGDVSQTWSWTVSEPTYVPLSIFMGMGAMVVLLFGSALVFTGIPAVFTSFLGFGVAALNSFIAVNGQLIQNIGGIDNSGNVVQGFTVLHIPMLSYLFIFVALIMGGLTIYHIAREIEYNKAGQYEEVEF